MVPIGEELPNLVKTPPILIARGAVLGARVLILTFAGLVLNNLFLAGLGLVLFAVAVYAVTYPSRHAPQRIVLTEHHVIGTFMPGALGRYRVRFRAIPYSMISDVRGAAGGRPHARGFSQIVLDRDQVRPSSVFVFGWGRLPTSKTFFLSPESAERLREALREWHPRSPPIPSDPASARARVAGFALSVPLRA